MSYINGGAPLLETVVGDDESGNDEGAEKLVGDNAVRNDVGGENEK